MCRLLAVLATLLPMLFHSVFGCCWHHAHSGCHSHFGATSIVDARPTEIHQHTCGHHQQTTDTSSSGLNGAPSCRLPQPILPSHQCDEEHCVYVVEKAHVFAVFQLSGWTSPGLNLAICPECLSDRIVGQISCVRDKKAGAELRALVQVWLV